MLRVVQSFLLFWSHIFTNLLVYFALVLNYVFSRSLSVQNVDSVSSHPGPEKTSVRKESCCVSRMLKSFTFPSFHTWSGLIQRERSACLTAQYAEAPTPLCINVQCVAATVPGCLDKNVDIWPWTHGEGVMQWRKCVCVGQAFPVNTDAQCVISATSVS